MIAAVLAVVAVGFVAVRKWRSSPEPERVRLAPAKVSEIKSIVELSTVELYEEHPLKGSIGKRHLVARVVMEGSVAFDLEKAEGERAWRHHHRRSSAREGDTARIDAPGSYTVIDAWNDDPFGSAQFTTAEENALKRRFTESAVRGVYRRGDVKRARESAAQSVRTLLSGATGRPVVVE